MYESYREWTAENEKAHHDVMDLISCLPAEEVWSMYCCASGWARYDLENAIKQLIEQGSETLSAQFPGIRP